VSCGVENKQRVGEARGNSIVGECIRQVKAAKLTQPITHSDTFGAWINWDSMAAQVDVISATIYSFFAYARGASCPSVDVLAQYHVDRIKDLKRKYPGKLVLASEWGWPNGSYRPLPGKCVVNIDMQQRVVAKTLQLMARENLQGILFGAFNQPWKAGTESLPVGPYWGMCAATSPYNCHFPAVLP